MTPEQLAKADDFLQWLGGPNGYISPLMLGDHWVAVQRLIHHGSLIGGTMHERASIRWRYCYDSTDSAYQAMIHWLVKECAGEPVGWHKRKSEPMLIERPQIVRTVGRTIDLWE